MLHLCAGGGDTRHCGNRRGGVKSSGRRGQCGFFKRSMCGDPWAVLEAALVDTLTAPATEESVRVMLRPISMHTGDPAHTSAESHTQLRNS